MPSRAKVKHCIENLHPLDKRPQLSYNKIIPTKGGVPMRFLHLSDLHLGKRVCEFSMLDDQRYILEQVLSLLDARPVDGVLLAGDLYDKPVPPAEAVRLLDWFLTELAARGLPVFAVSGNHDSADRIAFGAQLLAGSRVYVSPVFAAPPAPITLTDEYGRWTSGSCPF